MPETPTKPLTYKQQAFVDNYIANNGNGTQACRDAGYKGTTKALTVMAVDNLAKPSIKQAIETKQASARAELGRKILEKVELQAIWSDFIQDTTINTGDRLRAGELLHKTRGELTDNLQTSDITAIKQQTEQEQAELRRIAGIRLVELKTRIS